MAQSLIDALPRELPELRPPTDEEIAKFPELCEMGRQFGAIRQWHISGPWNDIHTKFNAVRGAESRYLKEFAPDQFQPEEWTWRNFRDADRRDGSVLEHCQDGRKAVAIVFEPVSMELDPKTPPAFRELSLATYTVTAHRFYLVRDPMFKPEFARSSEP